jgi:hypothetical protein
MKAYAVAITAPSRSRKPIRRSPIRRKPRKRQSGDDPAYRAFVRSFGCVVCYRSLLSPRQLGRSIYPDYPGIGYPGTRRQTSPTECAHVGRRGLSQKCPDYESLPLCAVEHHRIGPGSHHKLGKRFWGFHGLDRAELIAELQALYRAQGGILK